MTGDRNLAGPAQKAVDFIVASQDPQLGAWRYVPRDGADTSVAGWQLMALKSGELAGLRVPAATYERVSRWLDRAQVSGSQYVVQSRRGRHAPAATRPAGQPFDDGRRPFDAVVHRAEPRRRAHGRRGRVSLGPLARGRDHAPAGPRHVLLVLRHAGHVSHARQVLRARGTGGCIRCWSTRSCQRAPWPAVGIRAIPCPIGGDRKPAGSTSRR